MSHGKTLVEGSPRPHVPALDGIRGIAILMVVIYHCGKLDAGWLGVDIFFVLSGFLITGILVRAKQAPHYFRNFMGRRVLRIFPPYYAYLLLTLVLLPAFGLIPRGVGYGWVWTYLTNYPLARHGSWGVIPLDTQHLWSVAVEEQFYLLWPLVVWLVPARRLWLVCLAGIGAAFAFRTGLYLVHWTKLASAFFTASRMDSLLIGAFLALRPWRPGRVAIALAIGLLLALVITGNTGTDSLQSVYGYTLVAMAAGTVLAGSMSEPALARVFSWRPLRIAGKYSYTGYLVHFLLVEQLQDTFHMPSGTWRFTALVMVLTFCVAWASWRYFESPILALKSRFFPEPNVRLPIPVSTDAGAECVEHRRSGGSGSPLPPPAVRAGSERE